MNRETLTALISEHEDTRYEAYPDTKGILTIGIGMNLEEASARGRIEALGVDYDQLCEKECRLTGSQVRTLFNDDLDVAVQTAAQYISNFWDHPDNVQHAVIDMVFNLGGPRFSGFVNLISALEAKDYLRAAGEMADSLWAKQVPNRAADDIALVRSAA